jgi:hypothetical protein
MTRAASTYRGARRNAYRAAGHKFPWQLVKPKVKVIEAPPVRPNVRVLDSERKKPRQGTMDVTGWFGLMRSLVSRRTATRFEKKPKRGWAAKRRRTPFEPFFTGEKLRIAQARHVHPRHLREAL